MQRQQFGSHGNADAVEYEQTLTVREMTFLFDTFFPRDWSGLILCQSRIYPTKQYSTKNVEKFANKLGKSNLLFFSTYQRYYFNMFIVKWLSDGTKWNTFQRYCPYSPNPVIFAMMDDIVKLYQDLAIDSLLSFPIHTAFSKLSEDHVWNESRESGNF